MRTPTPMIRPNGQPPENLAAMALARSPAVGLPMPGRSGPDRPGPLDRARPSERRKLPSCLGGRDHVLAPRGSESAGGTGVARGTSGTGPSIGPAPGSLAVVPEVPACPGSRSWPGEADSLAGAPGRPGEDARRGTTAGVTGGG